MNRHDTEDMSSLSTLRKRLRAIRKAVAAHKAFVGGPFRGFRAWLFLLPRTKRMGRVICFAPAKPGMEYMIRQVGALLGYKATGDLREPAQLVVKWMDDTFPVAPREVVEAARTRRVANIGVTDISKSRVADLMEEIFGYSAHVDPTTWEGQALKKADLNAMDQEEILTCPIPLSEVDPHAVYQELLGEAVDGWFREHRLAWINGKLVTVVTKLRDPEQRFVFEASILSVDRVDEILSKDEQAKVGEFARRMGLDYGDLDTLRDSRGRLHIIDVNPTSWNQLIGDDPTPAGPALLHMARAWNEWSRRRCRDRLAPVPRVSASRAPVARDAEAAPRDATKPAPDASQAPNEGLSPAPR